MSTFNKVIPGKVNNEGIRSMEDLSNPVPVISSPAHFPDFAMVTPRGPTKRATVATATFLQKFGNTLEPFGSFYNPIALAISKLGQAGQASFGFKRLTNNEERARVICGVTVFESTAVPNYVRSSDGEYELDEAGNPVVDSVKPTVAGVFICPANLLVDIDIEVGKVKPFEVTAPAGILVPAGEKGKFYPMFELLSGIGDEYNSMYASFGHPFSTDWGEVARFVMTFGSYPFTMNMGELLETGLRLPATTSNGSPESTMTLFDTVGANNVRYGIQTAVDRYTGREVNRPVESRAAPFEDTYVYTKEIQELGQMLFEAEYVVGTGVAPQVSTKKLPDAAIMNPFTAVDHYGKPYRHVMFGGILSVDDKLVGTRMGMRSYLQATGGINPFADREGNYPKAPSTWIEALDGVWVTGVNSTAIVPHKQYWEMTQTLLEGHLITYAGSLDQKDVIRNRASFMWDLGYNDRVKNALIPFLARRKDLIVVMDASEYLKNKTQEQIYSTMESINTKLVMMPESDVYQTAACRAAINLWDAKVIDEPTVRRFSMNLDTMFAFATAGGGNDGKIYAALMPDHEGNRTIRIMHDPLVQFEDDDPAANNLIKGAITVTPLNTSQYCRPALPSVYSNINSVLKDLPNIWKCVTAEKIIQDLWIQVSGDTQIGKEGYVSFVKDNGERRIRELMGSVLSNWEVNPTFREDEPNGKATMYTSTTLYMGKGIYMMNSVLEANNEASMVAQ